MKLYYILTLLALHTVTATVNLQPIKDSAAKQLRTLEEMSVGKLQIIKDKLSHDLEIFQRKIKGFYEMLAKNYDLEKVKKLDILNVLPTLQNKPSYGHKQKAHYYLPRERSSDQSLVLTYDMDIPWPINRLDAEHI